MDQTRRTQISALHDQQRERATTYKPQVPDIPTAHGCAGECSQPPPPPPISNSQPREGFRGNSVHTEQLWWMILGGASIAFALLCLPQRR